jgi:hypothetical protein
LNDRGATLNKNYFIVENMNIVATFINNIINLLKFKEAKEKFNISNLNYNC